MAMYSNSISVLIITYNQQDVIGRALDSVLNQREYGLKEIVICDDNSTDDNWSVISSYVDKYPELIKAYRNEKNLGIYGNCERLVSHRGDADLYYLLSGDDALCDGFFEQVQSFIQKKNIDVANKAVALYFDWKVIRPKGSMMVVRNNKILKKVDPFRLRYRLLIYNRSSFITSKIIEKFKPVPKDKGVNFAEDLFEFQTQLYAEESYYYPCVGSVYYSQIGVSTKMRTRKHIEEGLYKWNTFLNLFDLNKKDVAYTMMKINLSQYALEPSLNGFFKVIFYAIKGIDLKLGLDYKQVYFFFRSIFNSTFKRKRQ